MIDGPLTCLPGEFDRQSAIMFGCGEWVHLFPKLLLQTVSVLYKKLPLILIVQSESQRQLIIAMLCDWGIPPDELQFVALPGSSMWIRDYGPGFVRTENGDIICIDGAFFPGVRNDEDAAPQRLADLLRMNCIQVPLDIEGGNILGNGQGLCITTASVLTANSYRKYDASHVQSLMSDCYGFSQWIHLVPLMNESTSHVDFFTTFTSPDTVVVGSFDSRLDRTNAWILDQNAERLSGLRCNGKPLNVVRIPMPPQGTEVCRTYTNVIYANGTLLVPIFPDVDPNPRGIFDLYSSLLPGWEIIGIDSSALSRYRGSLRCVSLAIPWLEDRFAVQADRLRTSPAGFSAPISTPEPLIKNDFGPSSASTMSERTSSINHGLRTNRKKLGLRRSTLCR